MSNKIKKVFLLFVIISLSGCAGAQWKGTSGSVASDSDVAGCEFRCGVGGVVGELNNAGWLNLTNCRTACMKTTGYSQTE